MPALAGKFFNRLPTPQHRVGLPLTQGQQRRELEENILRRDTADHIDLSGSKLVALQFLEHASIIWTQSLFLARLPRPTEHSNARRLLQGIKSCMTETASCATRRCADILPTTRTRCAAPSVVEPYF